jgi:hypothetical protein
MKVGAKPRGKRKRVRKQESTAVATSSSPLNLDTATALSEAEETRLIEWAAATLQRRRPGARPPRFLDRTTPAGVVAEQDSSGDPLWWAQLAEATGATHEDAQTLLMSQVCGVYHERGASPAKAIQSALALMLDIAPQGGIEGMIATQMVAIHGVAMDLLASGGTRSAHSIEVADVRLKHAERLMRLFGLHMETLNRHRGKAPSEQKVTVEHVHVHEGGQAIVGNVTTAPKPVAEPGGGGEAATR